MTRYHSTPDGREPFTPHEEQEADTQEAAWIAAEPEREAARAEEAAAVIEREQIKQMYAALKDGTGTQAVRLARVERVLARLLRDTYRD